MCTQLHQHHRRAPSWCRSGQSLQTSWPIASQGAFPGSQGTGRELCDYGSLALPTRGTQRFLSSGVTRAVNRKLDEFVMTKEFGTDSFTIYLGQISVIRLRGQIRSAGRIRTNRLSTWRDLSGKRNRTQKWLVCICEDHKRTQEKST